MKFVTLSDRMMDGTPRLEVHLSMPIKQLQVPIEGTNSKWTARVIKQVKRNPQRFLVQRFTDT